MNQPFQFIRKWKSKVESSTKKKNDELIHETYEKTWKVWKRNENVKKQNKYGMSGEWRWLVCDRWLCLRLSKLILSDIMSGLIYCLMNDYIELFWSPSNVHVKIDEIIIEHPIEYNVISSHSMCVYNTLIVFATDLWWFWHWVNEWEYVIFDETKL